MSYSYLQLGKDYVFQVEINVVAPCVKSPENSRKIPMKRTSDDVCSQLNIYSYDHFNSYLKAIEGLSGSRTRDLSHPKRESCHQTNRPDLQYKVQTTILICYSYDSAGVLTPLLCSVVVTSPTPLINGVFRVTSNSDY